MNFIIQIYSQSDTICSFVDPSLTTYSIESSDFGNYEIHSLKYDFKIGIVPSPLLLIVPIGFDLLVLFLTFEVVIAHNSTVVHNLE